jgi:heat shock protein HtpX
MPSIPKLPFLQRAIASVTGWLQTTLGWFTERFDGVALLAPAFAYLGLIGALFFGSVGFLIALMASAIIGLAGQRLSADFMLSLYGAEPIAPTQGASLRGALATLAQRADIKDPPALAVIPSLTVGAFAVGTHPRTALLVTEGLLRRHALSDVVALLAHEMSHIRNGDLPLFALADTLTRVAQVLAYVGLILAGLEALAWFIGDHWIRWWPIALLLLAPAANSQLQLNLAGPRERDADISAAELLGDPALLIAVLAKVTPDQGSPLDDVRLPVPQRRTPNPSPLRSHPPSRSRIAALTSRPPTKRHESLVVRDEPMVSLIGYGPIEMRPRNRWPGIWF